MSVAQIKVQTGLFERATRAYEGLEMLMKSARIEHKMGPLTAVFRGPGVTVGRDYVWIPMDDLIRARRAYDQIEPVLTMGDSYSAADMLSRVLRGRPGPTKPKGMRPGVWTTLAPEDRILGYRAPSKDAAQHANQTAVFRANGMLRRRLARLMERLHRYGYRPSSILYSLKLRVEKAKKRQY